MRELDSPAGGSRYVSALILLVGLLVSSSPCFGQAELNPNQITGTVSFNNTNPDIQAFLGANDGADGLSSVWFYLQSQDPPLTHHAWQYDGNETGTSLTYELTVETAEEGIAYTMRPTGYVRSNSSERIHYIFDQKDSGLIFPEPASDTTITFSECASLVHVNYVNKLGEPVTVYDTRLWAEREHHTESYQYFKTQAYAYGYDNQTSRSSVLVRADGSTVRLRSNFSAGLDIFSDKVRSECTQTITPQCDEVVEVTCVVPEGNALGSIAGTFDLLGVEEHLHSSTSRVKAYWGPLNNAREFQYRSTPASGPFTLPNLVPSDIEGYRAPYYVWAEALFGLGYNAQYLRTPFTSSSSDAGTYVTAGETTELGSIMEMEPATVTGTLTLAGPPPGEYINCLDGLYRDMDGDRDGDGIPDSGRLYYSNVQSTGAYNRADGSLYSAWGGIARASFPGSVDAESGIFEGDYRLLLANLNNEAAFWRKPSLQLNFRNYSSNDPAFYQLSQISVGASDQYSSTLAVQPGSTHTRNFSYCLSKVTITHRTSSGSFYQPSVRGAGTFTGLDYTGASADYKTQIQYAYGTPNYRDAAAQEGQVVLCLPEGEYEFSPHVIAVGDGGTYTNVELQKIHVSVGCQQELEVSTDLQIALTTAPTSSTSRTVTIAGLTFSDGNVTAISYIQNGAEETILCSDCGINAEFSADVVLTLGTNDFEFIATDEFGNRSSVKTSVEFTPLPVTLSGCADISYVIPDAGEHAAISWDVAASGGCDTPVVSCSPASGSHFSLGETAVTCSAADSCSSEASCSFTVTVSNTVADKPQPTPEPTPEPTPAGCAAEDTRPAITLSLETEELWPPRHKFIPIGGTVAAVNTCNGEVTQDTGQELIPTVTVWSDETEVPEKGDGSGNFAPDAMTDNGSLQLRAERRGTENGRVYLLVAEATNDADVSSVTCTAVVVPHSRRARARATVFREASLAVAYCNEHGGPVPGYTQHGLSAELGHQKVVNLRKLEKRKKRRKRRRARRMRLRKLRNR